MFSILFIFILMVLPVAATPASSHPVESLIQDAQNLKLSQQRTWLKLLHYENNILGNKVSQVKDPRFFLSSNGSKNANDELVTTLKSFFENIVNTKQESGVSDQHSICRFPARLKWLKKKLEQNSAWSFLPQPDCRYFNTYLENINAQSVAFVFSSYYANNPSSAFGHTFFRINKKVNSKDGKQELLDYGISYAADVTTDNSILYVWNGLFGRFKGTFSSVPYYFKVQEYNNFESRDLWSYELNLNDQELTQFINHLWEVAPAHFDYYFLTQNCSYQMLTLLEAAVDDVRLSEAVPFYVIPADAIKAVVQTPGLVKSIEFRPSLRRQFETQWKSFTESEKKSFASIVRSDPSITRDTSIGKSGTPAFDDLVPVKVYDALIDYVEWQDPKGNLKREGAWYKKKQALLEYRAQRKEVSTKPEKYIPTDEQPDRSHASARVSSGIGRTQTVTDGYLGFRFAFHDLLDSHRGLTQYSQVEFGRIEFQTIENLVYLNEFSLFNLLQLNPVSETNRKFSWGFDFGVKNLAQCSGAGRCLGSGLQIMGGYAVGQAKQILWFMPYVQYYYSDVTQKRHYSAVGYQLGYLAHLAEDIKLLFKYYKTIPNQLDATDSVSLQARYNYSINQAVEIHWQKANVLDDTSETAKVLFHLFF